MLAKPLIFIVVAPCHSRFRGNDNQGFFEVMVVNNDKFS